MKPDNTVTFKQSTLLPWVELRIADNSHACYDAHSHDEFSFGIIDSGQACYTNQKRSNQISQGDIVTINPGDIHACNPERRLNQAAAWSYRMLFVDSREMAKYQREVSSKHAFDYTPFDSDYQRSTRMTQQFEALFHCLSFENCPLAAQTQFLQFVALCFAQSSNHSPSQASPNLKRVREMLLDDIATSHQLEHLAEEVGLSRYQLVRNFKQQYGLPPHAYLINEKIKRAKNLLKTGNTISEVAHQLGFADQAHFQRQFKRKLSVTPKYYQSHFID
ncbi:AraC family transcriptional regulator [Vibrio panuliri]|uniref:Transcriptional regulator n=1 Tax=Vibrio panuliri TaxID=1381081 RepID=A0ABX3FJZ5_9VIBR|nr:AraC family transcriptional regulator [Vibrio panuliri]KAB1457852.1 AraC family transcriptional regulator [Vibrio panuliri]OLQ94519.1 transcriptional regulator [Vibrio panuliri]